MSAAHIVYYPHLLHSLQGNKQRQWMPVEFAFTRFLAYVVALIVPRNQKRSYVAGNIDLN